MHDNYTSLNSGPVFYENGFPADIMHADDGEMMYGRAPVHNDGPAPEERFIYDNGSVHSSESVRPREFAHEGSANHVRREPRGPGRAGVSGSGADGKREASVAEKNLAIHSN